MEMDLFAVEPLTAAFWTSIALVITALARWSGVRSGARRDIAQMALERVSKLEGMLTVMQSQLNKAMTDLTESRMREVGLEYRIADLEEDLAEAQAENARLRGLRPPARALRRAPTPERPFALDKDERHLVRVGGAPPEEPTE